MLQKSWVAAVALVLVGACSDESPDTSGGAGTSAAGSGAAGGVGGGGGAGASGGEPGGPPLRVSNGAIVDGTGAKVQLRCVNLGGWLHPEPHLIGDDLAGLLKSATEMKEQLVTVVGPTSADQFWRAYEDTFITDADIAAIAESGFNCVRLVMSHRTLLQESTPGNVALSSEGIARIDDAVGWATAHEIYVVLDLHTAPGGQNPLPPVSDVPSTDTTPRLWEGPEAADNKAVAIELWGLLAARYVDEPWVAGFDLLNEPSLPAATAKSALNDLYVAIIDEIRGVDPDHIVFLEGDVAATDLSVLTAAPDPQSAYSFHAYTLFGSAWDDPTPQTPKLVEHVDFAAARNRPLFLGEFGEDELAWQAAMVTAVESHGIGWAVWPWKRKANPSPVLRELTVPPTWNTLFKHLVAPAFNPAPSVPEAEQGMADLLVAIELDRCAADETLAAALTTP